MDYLRITGIGNLVKDFIERKNITYVGFSAGACIITPSIKICGFDWNSGKDDNYLNLTELSGLNILNFEILPHYNKQLDEENLMKYISASEYEVKTITNDEFLIIDL